MGPTRMEASPDQPRPHGTPPSGGSGHQGTDPAHLLRGAREAAGPGEVRPRQCDGLGARDDGRTEQPQPGVRGPQDPRSC